MAEEIVSKLAPTIYHNSFTEICTSFVVNEWKRQPFFVRAVLWCGVTHYRLSRGRSKFDRIIASKFSILSNPARLILNWILLSLYDQPDMVATLGCPPKQYFQNLSFYNSNENAEPTEDGIPEEVDYLVMGSGAGGALTAYWLAKQGKSVLIAEEGPWENIQNARCGITYTFPRIWRDGGIIPILGNTKLAFAEGCCAGGSTMLNSGLFHRIPLAVRKDWANRFQLKNLDDLDSYHEQIEKALSVQEIPQPQNQACTRLREGAELCGFHGIQVPVASKGSEGHLSKQHMQATYLNDALANGAQLLTHCRVQKIICEKHRVVGVQILCRTREKFIRCRHLILCGGPLQTPLLLRRSGITRNIGNSVNFHPTLRVLADFGEPINAFLHEMPFYQVKEFAPKITLGASVSAPAFFATLLSARWPHMDPITAAKQMALYYVSVTGSTKGVIRNFGSSYLVRYSLSSEDIQAISTGFKHLAELLFAAGAKSLYTSIEDAAPIHSIAEAHVFAQPLLPQKKLQLMTIHAFSSCPIGENRELCAADSYGRVFDYHNLFINDASMLPSSPTANPQGPLMALALRNLTHNFPR